MSDFNIVIDNIWTYLKPNININPNVYTRIESEMSYTVEEYNRWRKTYVNFDIPLFERSQLRYPTGLYSTLDNILTKCGYTFDVIDARKVPEIKQPLTFYGKNGHGLRDYQEEVVEDAIKAQRGVIKIATGGGKTVIAAAIVAKLNMKTLFVVYSVDLLEQTADEFETMFHIKVGKIGGGYCEIERINVCTVQTLHTAFDLKYDTDSECFIKEKISPKVLERKEEIRQVVEEAEMVIEDECHKATCATYVEMNKVMTRAYCRFGLSATPYRDASIDKVLEAYSGKLICNITASYLIDRSYLVPPKIYVLDPNEHQKYKFVRKSFRSIYEKWITNNDDRNGLIVDCALRLQEMNRITLITVTRIPHGEILSEMLDKAGAKSVAFIRGEVDKTTRKDLLNQIREKKLKILIGTSVADEGLDLPALDSAILAGGGKSLIKSLQRIGRTLRPYPDAEHNEKKEAIIVDFYDRLRYLTGHSVKRIKIFQSEHRFEVLKHF
jgi:superfamily II DNA or RNA helicase